MSCQTKYRFFSGLVYVSHTSLTTIDDFLSEFLQHFVLSGSDHAFTTNNFLSLPDCQRLLPIYTSVAVGINRYNLSFELGGPVLTFSSRKGGIQENAAFFCYLYN